MEPLKFEPILKEVIWGGSRISQMLDLKSDKLIGENWTLSLRNDNISVVSEGKYKGSTFENLVEENKKDMLGNSFLEIKDFPLLVKIINSENDLSIQVHPDDYYANTKLGLPYGKNEMWYVLEAKENAKLVVGLKNGISKEDFKSAVENNKVMECLNTVPVKSGDIIDIPAGLVHAITSGLLVAEIQQNSDTTFRIYDYDRVDNSGQKRELHLEQALGVIDFEGKLKTELCLGNDILKENLKVTKYINNQYFTVDKYEVVDILEEESLYDKFTILLFVDGEGKVEYDDLEIQVKMGDTIFIPAYLGKYKIIGNVAFLKVVPNK